MKSINTKNKKSLQKHIEIVKNMTFNDFRIIVVPLLVLATLFSYFVSGLGTGTVLLFVMILFLVLWNVPKKEEEIKSEEK